jgi:hypothetical protein
METNTTVTAVSASQCGLDSARAITAVWESPQQVVFSPKVLYKRITTIARKLPPRQRVLHSSTTILYQVFYTVQTKIVNGQWTAFAW